MTPRDLYDARLMLAERRVGAPSRLEAARQQAEEDAEIERTSEAVRARQLRELV